MGPRTRKPGIGWTIIDKIQKSSGSVRMCKDRGTKAFGDNMVTTITLAREDADILIKEINEAVDRVHARHRKEERRLLKMFASRLAKFPEDLIRYIVTNTRIPGDLVWKARAFGLGDMPEHIYDNEEIKYSTWKKLPTNSKVELSAPNTAILIHSRNRIKAITPKELVTNPYETRKILSARKPQRGILKTADEQNAPRPYPSGQPRYFRFAGVKIRDGDRVLVTLKLGTSEIVVAFTKDELTEILSSFK